MMIKPFTIALLALTAFGFLSTDHDVHAQPRGIQTVEGSQPFTLSPIVADCRGAARDTVARTGGELLSAVPAMEDGQPVCRITVLVGDAEGERPKKISVTVPLS